MFVIVMLFAVVGVCLCFECFCLLMFVFEVCD